MLSLRSQRDTEAADAETTGELVKQWTREAVAEAVAEDRELAEAVREMRAEKDRSEASGFTSRHPILVGTGVVLGLAAMTMYVMRKQSSSSDEPQSMSMDEAASGLGVTSPEGGNYESASGGDYGSSPELDEYGSSSQEDAYGTSSDEKEYGTSSTDEYGTDEDSDSSSDDNKLGSSGS